MWIIVAGNPMDGINFWGPFDDPNDANHWADTHCKDTDWWASELSHPDEME